MRKLISIIFVLTLLVDLQAADWQSSIKNLRLGKNNTILFLQYQGSDFEGSKDFLVEVVFREQGKLPVVLFEEKVLKISPDRMIKMGFSLEPGSYELSVDITDIENARHIRLPQMTYQATIKQDQLSVSDIFLTYSPINRAADATPILDVNIRPDKEQLSFMMEIYTTKKEEFTIRSVLYQRIDSLSTKKIVIWVDKQNTNRVLRIYDRTTSLREKLDISNLTEGNYLIQVLIYRNAELFFRPSAEFTIEGNTRQRIFENLPEAIRMMKYVAEAAQIDSLLLETDSLAQERTFRQYWNRLFGDDGDEEMIAYYKKLFKIEEVMLNEGESWDSDRAEIYLQYGEPSRKQFEYKGQLYERWVYLKYDISFLFEKRNQQYVLVE